VLYILCIVIEGGIFISHLIWRFRTRKIRAQAKEDGKTFDDIAEECRRENVQFRFAEREVTLPFFRSKPDAPGSLEAGEVQGKSFSNPLEISAGIGVESASEKPTVLHFRAPVQILII
jgi:hypothetical protein